MRRRACGIALLGLVVGCSDSGAVNPLDAGGAVVDRSDARGAVDSGSVAVDAPAAVDVPGIDGGEVEEGCGNACAPGQTCRDGACVAPACPPGMALIPEGMFQMGESETATPVHGVRLSAFCLDVTEVTVAAYRMCTASSCVEPGTSARCNWIRTGRDDHPVNCVNWSQSRAYCQWRGGDLPTEAQWEYAARGSDGRLYPWGNDPVPDSYACWSGREAIQTSTCPVGSFPAGNSPFGLVDMTGNVYEWTLDWYAVYAGSPDSYVLNPTGPSSGTTRVDRGGAWDNFSFSELRAPARYSDLPAVRYTYIGFRCAHAPI